MRRHTYDGQGTALSINTRIIWNRHQKTRTPVLVTLKIGCGQWLATNVGESGEYANQAFVKDPSGPNGSWHQIEDIDLVITEKK